MAVVVGLVKTVYDARDELFLDSQQRCHRYKNRIPKYLFGRHRKDQFEFGVVLDLDPDYGILVVIGFLKAPCISRYIKQS